MTTAAPLSARASQRPSPADRRRELFNDLRAAARDIQRHRSLDGLLRAFSRMLLPALAGSKRDDIEAFAEPLRYAAGCLAHESEATGDGILRQYLIGRVDALLELCAIASEHMVSEAVVERVKNNDHAKTVLCMLANGENVRRADIAARLIGLSPSALSNLLGWMEEAHLIRRRSLGRETCVVLGPKGEVAKSVLNLELAASTQQEPQRKLTPSAVTIGALRYEVITSAWDHSRFTITQQMAADVDKANSSYLPMMGADSYGPASAIPDLEIARAA